MKKCTIILLLVAAGVWQLRAQDSLFVASPPSKDYITTIKLEDPRKFPLHVTIVEIRDSSLILSPLITKKDFSPSMFPLTEVTVFDIESIKIHRPNRIIRGALNGVIIGFAIGAIAGLADGSDPQEEWFSMTAGQKAVLGGIAMGVFGGAAGALVGPMLSVNFPINGSLDVFRRKKPNMVRYQLMPPTTNTMNLYPQ